MSSSLRPNSRGPVLLDSHKGPTRKARRVVLRSNSISDLRDVRSRDTHCTLQGTDDPNFLRMDVVWTLPTSRKGKSWRDGRKLLERSLRPGATDLQQRIIEEKTHLFLGQLLSTPKDFREHIDLLVASLCFPRRLLTCLQSSRKVYHVPHLWVRFKRK